ncbi:hypothetical protein V8F33_010070 [Rhypophila sp. PSN 637]
MDETRFQQLIQQALAAQEQRFSVTITELQSGLAAIKTSSPSLNLPKPRLPNPDKFDGTLSTWEVWYPEMKAKLRIAQQALGEEEAQFWYIYSRLEKKVQALVAPQIAYAEREQSYKTQALFDQLARLCDNPNTKRDAEDKALLSLPAEANKWTDGAKIALLRRQLNDKMKRRLKTQITVPTTYPQFVKLLQQLDDGAVNRQAKVDKAGGDPMVIGAMHRQEDSGSDGSDTGKYRKV